MREQNIPISITPRIIDCNKQLDSTQNFKVFNLNGAPISQCVFDSQTTLSIIGLFMILSIIATQHNNTTLSAVMLSATFLHRYAECRYGECLGPGAVYESYPLKSNFSALDQQTTQFNIRHLGVLTASLANIRLGCKYQVVSNTLTH